MNHCYGRKSLIDHCVSQTLPTDVGFPADPLTAVSRPEEAVLEASDQKVMGLASPRAGWFIIPKWLVYIGNSINDDTL